MELINVIDFIYHTTLFYLPFPWVYIYSVSFFAVCIIEYLCCLKLRKECNLLEVSVG